MNFFSKFKNCNNHVCLFVLRKIKASVILLLSLLIILNNQHFQWEPPTLDKVDDGKLDLVFQPFEKNLELQIPENEECRLVSASVLID